MRRFMPSAVVLLAAGLTLTIAMPGGVVPRTSLADEAVTDSDRPERRPPTEAEIAVLIERLSHDDYQVREPVAAKLVRIGIAARPLLLEALVSPDLEIRHRATRILTIIVEEDFQTRVTAFATDVDGKNKATLPGWSRFGERLAPDKYGRALFVEMHQSESDLLGVYDRVDGDAREVSHAFSSRCREIEEMLQTYPTRMQSEISLGTVATLILIGSEQKVATTDKVSLFVTNLIRSSGAFVTGMRVNSKQPLLRKMLGDWVAKSTMTNSASLILANLRFAMVYDLKEGLAPAVQIVNQTAVVPGVRSLAALAIGKLGSAKNLPDLEPLLEDTTLCSSGRIIINNKTKSVSVQLRDVALAVMVHLSGQQLSDYGYRSVTTRPDQLFLPSSLAFYDDEQRDAALAKWKAWSSRNRPDPDPSANDEGRKAKDL